MFESWFNQSIMAMFCLIPAWLAIEFFSKNYQVSSDIFLIWYFLGIFAGSALFKGLAPSKIISIKIIVAIFIIGLTIGTFANLQLFRAVTNASNPGLPVAIANLASVGVFLTAALFSQLLPRYFNSVKIDYWSFCRFKVLLHHF